MTEIKYRGPLTKIQKKHLSEYLKNKGQLVESVLEKVVFFDTSIFPAIGDFATGFSRLSLRIIRSKATLRIKKGNPSDHKRNEVALSIKKNQVPKLVYILNSLGLKNGFYRPAFRRSFFIDNFIVSIKTKCVMGDHFEIELLKGSAIKNHPITLLMKKFSLYFWSRDEYQKRIYQKMKKFPAVNVYDSKFWQELK